MVSGLVAGVVFGQDYGATSSWQKFKGKAGSKEGIKQSFEKPLTEDTPMTDISSTTSFSGRVRCPSKKSGIEVVFIPLGGGDHRLIVKEDLDLDGTYEYLYDTNPQGIRVSGVCASGVVSCSPGSWTNCEYYFWDVTAGGYVKLLKTDDTSLLGGCFCSNSSCGVDTLAEEAVNMIAGGVSQAVMRARSDLGVSMSGFDVSTFTLRLRVQQSQGCGSGGYGETDVGTLSSYYKTQSQPPSMDYVLSNPQVQQSNDSPYYLVNKASEVQVEGGKIGIPNRVSCDVRNDVSVYTTDLYENCQNTWTDKNGETWCIAQGFDKDRGGSFCGGMGCRDCPPLYQGSNNWVVCGEITFTSKDGTLSGISYSCSSEPCFTYDKVPQSNPVCSNEDDWGTYIYWCGSYLFRQGSQTGSRQYQCGEDAWDGTPIYCTDTYYQLLCREPLQSTVTLHYQQKWAVRVQNERGAGDRGGYWYYVWRNDNTWDYGVWTGKPNACREFELFRVLGTASEEGEAHLVGGIQEQYSWGKNHEYPSRYGHIWVLKSQVYKGDMVSLSQTNTCPTDDRCVLKNEWICDNTGNNCIQTIKEGAKTFNPSNPVCYTTGTQIATYTVCAYGDRIEVRGNPDVYNQTFSGNDMWFWIKREYECPPTEVPLNLERTEAVLSDSGTKYDPNTGELTVSDYTCTGGVCSPSDTYRAQLSTADTCPVATCSVRVPDTDASVFSDRTNRSQTVGGTGTPVMEIRACDKSSGSWVCPTKVGETVIEDCACDRGLAGAGFSTSISVLQAAVDASKDIICSTVSQ